MSETARFFVLQFTFIAVVLILHTYLGLHIIRRTIIFADLALDQTAAMGTLLGVWLGISYGSIGSYLMATLAVIGGALVLALVQPRNRLVSKEVIIGIVYALALVLSLLLGDKIPGGDAYVQKTLTGSILWVSWPLVLITTVVYIGLMVFHYRFRERFITLIAKPEDVPNSRFWDFLLFLSLGIITVLVIPIAGVLLAYALLMIPAAIAALFFTDWKHALMVGWASGFLSCAAGLGASYAYNLPYGPSLVMALGITFLGAIFLRVLLNRKEARI